MIKTRDHYRQLFSKLEQEFGALSEETPTGILGFSAGGPVSVSRVPGRSVFITCELSLYPEQVLSSDQVRYELLCRLPLGALDAQSLLTALATCPWKHSWGTDTQ